MNSLATGPTDLVARILVITDGPTGMRYACVELSRRLAAAGHEVTFAGPASERPLSVHHDLGFQAIESTGIQAFLAEDANRGFLDRLRSMPERREAARATIDSNHFLNVLDACQPDLVLLDGEMQEHVVLTVARGVPVCLLNTFASIWRRPGSPPPHTAIRPGFGFWGSPVGISLAWSGFIIRKRLRGLAKRVRQVGCDRVSTLDALAQEHGLDLRRETDTGQWLIPFTWTRLPTLSLHALEFEFPHTPPRDVHYVGPMCLQERCEPAMRGDDRQRLDRALDRNALPDQGRVLIYAGFGSFFTAHLQWVKNLIEAVAKKPQWTLVLSLGGADAKAELGELPPGVEVFPWVPQLEVLAQADVAVVHGGINTIDECVMEEVPMLVCSGKKTDMSGNLARVLHLGIGRSTEPAKDSPEQITQLLGLLIDDTACRQRLRRLRMAFARYAEERALERVVDQLLTGAGGKRA